MYGKRHVGKPAARQMRPVYTRFIGNSGRVYDPENPGPSLKVTYTEKVYHGMVESLKDFDRQGSVRNGALKMAIQVTHRGEPVWLWVHAEELEGGAYVGYGTANNRLLVRPSAKDFKTVDGLIKALFSAAYESGAIETEGSRGTITGVRIHSQNGKGTFKVRWAG